MKAVVSVVYDSVGLMPVYVVSNNIIDYMYTFIYLYIYYILIYIKCIELSKEV